MSADITEERIEATILAIRERLSFNRSIEEQTVLALYAQRNEARSQLAALQPAPQGVEVPGSEMGRALETHLPYTADCNAKDVAGYRIGFRIGWSAARLVPTPPQAAPGPEIEALDPPKRDKDCGDCTRLAICNGELERVRRSQLRRLDRLADQRCDELLDLDAQDTQGDGFYWRWFGRMVAFRDACRAALHIEEEDGSNRIHKMFDEAFERVLEDCDSGTEEIKRGKDHNGEGAK